jgi:hypothetical protein
MNIACFRSAFAAQKVFPEQQGPVGLQDIETFVNAPAPGVIGVPGNGAAVVFAAA